jgi:hypothetical protein
LRVVVIIFAYFEDPNTNVELWIGLHSQTIFS